MKDTDTSIDLLEPEASDEISATKKSIKEQIIHKSNSKHTEEQKGHTTTNRVGWKMLLPDDMGAEKNSTEPNNTEYDNVQSSGSAEQPSVLEQLDTIKNQLETIQKTETSTTLASSTNVLKSSAKIEYTRKDFWKFKIFGKITPWLFLAPFLLFLLVFSVYPVFNTIIMSFRQDYNPITNSDNGIGLGNFDNLFGNPDFMQALTNTFKYVALVVPITLCIAVFFASMLNKKVKGMAIFQTAFFMPLVTSTVAVGYVWRFIFNSSDIGLLNTIIRAFGGSPVAWLNSPKFSLLVLVVFGVWNGIPFATMIILSSMQRINKRYYTSARMDNANRWQQFRHITIPMLVPTILVLAVLNMLSSLKIFNDVYIMFDGPGPLSNFYTLVYYVYNNLQGKGMGLAAAAAVFLMMLALIGSIILFVVRNFGSINIKKMLPKKMFKGRKVVDVDTNSSN